MWREAVRASGLTMGLAELSTARFVELSPRAAELLGTTPQEGEGLDYLSVAERPREAAEVIRLARRGMIDGIRGRRKFLRADGSVVEVESSGWVVRSGSGPDLGLWMARELPSANDEPAPADETVTGPRSAPACLEPLGTRLLVDEHWCLATTSNDTGPVLGRRPNELRRNSIIELAHPDDRAALLFAFARATSEARVDVPVRLCYADGSWLACTLTPTVLGGLGVIEGDSAFMFAVVVAVAKEPWPDAPGEARRLAGHLRRMAAQIEAAGLPADPPYPFVAPDMTELSARQREVISRLVRGERVATIAAGMFVSQSTVRNHLSTIFRKVGVHSQTEFLALWHAGAGGPPA